MLAFACDSRYQTAADCMFFESMRFEEIADAR